MAKFTVVLPVPEDPCPGMDAARVLPFISSHTTLTGTPKTPRLHNAGMCLPGENAGSWVHLDRLAC